MAGMRLDKALANSGYGTRSFVKKLIRGGRVKVDGQVIDQASFKLDDPETAKVRIDEKPVRIKKSLLFMMNKPAGHVTALKDHKHPVVADLIDPNLLTAGLIPIGRLDLDTTGLLLFTTDGLLCHRLTSPKRNVAKTYYLEVSGKSFGPEDKTRLAQGLIIDGHIECRPADFEILSESSGLLTITEGKYRQVRKMMAVLGGNVTKLHRTSLGPLKLDEKLLPAGKMRELTSSETKALYQAAGLDTP